VTLTSLQKAAGRQFRQDQLSLLRERNQTSPPGMYVMALWRVPRHDCPVAGGTSTGTTLRERYDLSPEYRVCYCSMVGATARYFPHDDCDGSKVAAPAGLFAFVWKEGRCSGCGLTSRSGDGLVVLAADRPPDHGRREDAGQASSHPGNT
jgi:hypothetical protein